MHTIRAHDQAGDIEKRLDDSLEESSDTVDVSSSEYSASSDSESEKENLVSQETTCDGGERRKPAKRNASTTTKTSQPRKKSKVSNFSHYSRFTQQKYDTFRGKKSLLKHIYSGKGSLKELMETETPLMGSCLY